MDNAPGIAAQAADRTSDVDLILLTLALVVSALLSILPSPRVRALTEAAQTSTLHALSSLALALAAIALAVVALALGWTRDLSFDAVSAVVFALVPALFNMPRDLFSHLAFSIAMRRRATLRLTARNFCYVRVGRICSWVRSPSSWPRRFKHCAEGCDVTLYVRFLPHDLRAREPPRVAGAAAVATNTQWYGSRVFHTPHVVVLRDLNSGPKAWWFNAIKSATWLVANPALARLDTRERVLNALALLADLVVVGDLVLHLRRGFFEDQIMTNGGVRRAASAAPAFIANHILSQVGLSEWGLISRDIVQPGYVYPRSKPEEYALLFFVLTEKSKFYAHEVPLEQPGSPPPSPPVPLRPPQHPRPHPPQPWPGAADGLPRPAAFVPDRGTPGPVPLSPPQPWPGAADGLPRPAAFVPDRAAPGPDEGATAPPSPSPLPPSPPPPPLQRRAHAGSGMTTNMSVASTLTTAPTARVAPPRDLAFARRQPEPWGQPAEFPMLERAAAAARRLTDAEPAARMEVSTDGRSDGGSDTPAAATVDVGVDAAAAAAAEGHTAVELGATDDTVTWSSRLGTYVRRNAMLSGLEMLEKLLAADMRAGGARETDARALEREAAKWVDEWLVSWGVSADSLRKWSAKVARGGAGAGAGAWPSGAGTEGEVVRMECNVNALRRRRYTMNDVNGAEVGSAELTLGD